MPVATVIDDDRDFLALMTDVLADRGWRSIPCASSLEGYDALKDVVPDVIILDIRMETSESGWDVLTFLQSHPTLHGLPVIVCSASARDVEARLPWLEQHGVALLPKPFDLDVLYGILDRLPAGAGFASLAVH